MIVVVMVVLMMVMMMMVVVVVLALVVVMMMMMMMMLMLMIMVVVVAIMMMMMVITILVPINKNIGYFEDIRETESKLCRVALWDCFGNGLLTLFSARPCNGGSFQVSGETAHLPLP